jgi:rubrerythrin
MKPQLNLIDFEPVETREDTRERIRRVTAKLEGVPAKRKMRWLCLNCNYGWWDSRKTGPKGVCPECGSVRTEGALR